MLAYVPKIPNRNRAPHLTAAMRALPTSHPDIRHHKVLTSQARVFMATLDCPTAAGKYQM